MRWGSQQVTDDGIGARAVLPGMGGLLRTVRAPEFAGMVFHEVEARSALNRVPGGALPFAWTVNPYRGCSHACAYCLAGETPVLLADGRTRELGSMRVGEEIFGTHRHGGARRLVPTIVRAHWATVRPAFRVVLADGTRLRCGAEHRFLTERGWRRVAADQGALVVGDTLCGLDRSGSSQEPPVAGTQLSTADPGREVVAIEPLGVELPMYDITTGTGDFVAAGVVSHNCFARNTHTYLDLDPGEDFNRQVVVKVNVARVLERELRSARWRREHVAMGTNTDPYQRAEGRYALMPGVIRALARSGTPFSVLTKGTLLARDLPLLASVSADVSVGLGVSIALTDRELQASLEPGTPTPAARLELVRRITDAGLSCRVMVAPVLPLLTDSVAALDELLGAVAAAGAIGATVLPLHLRPGTREWFLGWLGSRHPELLGPYRQLYARGAYVDRRYREALAARVAPLLRRHGLAGSTDRRAATSRAAGGGPSAGVDDGHPPDPGGEQLTLL